MQQVLIMSVVLLWIVVLLNLLLTLGVIRRLNDKSSTQLDPMAGSRLQSGTPAPDFTAKTLDGQEVSLATYAGRTVAFLFTSSHCDACREMIPDILSLSDASTRSGVELIFVILDNIREARALIEEFEIDMPVLVAPLPGNDFAEKYKSTATPSYCIVDGQGLVQSAGHTKVNDWNKLAATWRKQKSQATTTVPVERS